MTVTAVIAISLAIGAGTAYKWATILTPGTHGITSWSVIALSGIVMCIASIFLFGVAVGIGVGLK